VIERVVDGAKEGAAVAFSFGVVEALDTVVELTVEPAVVLREPNELELVCRSAGRIRNVCIRHDRASYSFRVVGMCASGS
jgi:hypothetical protein